MANPLLSRREAMPPRLNHKGLHLLTRVPVFPIDAVRLLATDPALLPACSDYAKRFHPRAGALARAV